jgi:hypothetical protein
MGPIVIAPIIAPNVRMEPNTEYCIQIHRNREETSVWKFSRSKLEVVH